MKAFIRFPPTTRDGGKGKGVHSVEVMVEGVEFHFPDYNSIRQGFSPAGLARFGIMMRAEFCDGLVNPTGGATVRCWLRAVG